MIDFLRTLGDRRGPELLHRPLRFNIEQGLELTVAAAAADTTLVGGVAAWIQRADAQFSNAMRLLSRIAGVTRAMLGPVFALPRATAREQSRAARNNDVAAWVRTLYQPALPTVAFQRLDGTQLLRCFREAARVLVPGGTFAFDVLLPDLEWLTWDPDERHSVTHFTHPRTRAAMVYSTNHTYDPHTQVCHVRIFYDDAPKRPRAFKPPPESKQVVHLAHRQIFPEELRMLVATAGLVLDTLGSNFRDAKIAKGTDSQCGISRKPTV